MRGEWPHEEIQAEIGKLLSGRDVRLKLPIDRLPECSTLGAVLAREIGLGEFDIVKLTSLTRNILTDLVGRDKSPEMRMVRELIGLFAHSAMEIDEIIAHAVDSRVRSEDKRNGVYAKSCRRYLAGYSQTPQIKAKTVESRQERLIVTLDGALFRYIDEHLDAARSIASELRLLPTDDDGPPKRAIDPLVHDSVDLLEGIRAGNNEPYVTRSSLEARFRQLRHEQVPVICFVGPPAMGKTRVAEKLTATEKHPDGVTVRIDAGSDEQLERSLAKFLESVSVSPPYGLVWLESAFRQEILKASPWYLLIDNVVDVGLLSRLVPPTLRTTVVLTANRRLKGIPSEQCVEVAELEPHESVELILRLLPSSSKVEADRLAAVFAHHPMAITTVCGMLAGSRSLSIESFILDLRQTAALVFDGETDSGRPNLTAIYRQVLAELERIDPLAQLLLKLITLLGDMAIDSSILVISLGNVKEYAKTTLEQRRAIVGRSLRQLRDRYLISVVPDAESVGIRLHQLARDLLRGLIDADDSAKIRQALLRGMSQVVRLAAKPHEGSSSRDYLGLFGQLFNAIGGHLVDLCKQEVRPGNNSLEGNVESLYMTSALILEGLGADLVRILVAVVAGPGDSYGVRLVTTDGELPIQLGVRLDRSDLDAAVGPSGKFVTKAGMRRYTIGDERIQIPTMLIARTEDVEE